MALRFSMRTFARDLLRLSSGAGEHLSPTGPLDGGSADWQEFGEVDFSHDAAEFFVPNAEVS